jgi:glycosyltransferase involved in cell wall biosynthesis
MKVISIIIPVYNEENHIEKVIRSVLKSNTFNFKKEIIVVDDGSTDKTQKILKKLQKRYKEIKIVFNKKNCGKGTAVKKGLLNSTGDIIIVQDADPEYSPDDYPLLLEPFVKYNADAVYGSRFITNRPHRVLYFWHYLSNLFLTTLSNMFTNLNLTDMETGYKAFKGDLIRKLTKNLKSKRFGFEPEITAKLAK